MSIDLIRDNLYRFETLREVKYSLISLYIALVLPIPFMPYNGHRVFTSILFVFGLFFIINITLDAVTACDQKVTFRTSALSNFLGKKNWDLFWKDIKTIKSIRTSQGSKVYYFITKNEEKLLIPQRIEKYDYFLEIIQNKTKLNTTNMRYLAPLWTYKLLTFISTFMIIGEITSFLLRYYQY